MASATTSQLRDFGFALGQGYTVGFMICACAAIFSGLLAALGSQPGLRFQQ